MKIQFEYRGKLIQISKTPKGNYEIVIEGKHIEYVSSRKYATSRAMDVINYGV